MQEGEGGGSFGGIRDAEEGPRCQVRVVWRLGWAGQVGSGRCGCLGSSKRGIGVFL